MNEEFLRHKIARLEFEQDQLLSELQYVDQLLRDIGFSDGLVTIKSVALEIREEANKTQNSG